MMNSADSTRQAWWDVLLANPARGTLEPWEDDLSRLLAPEAVTLHRSGGRRETVERIEAGGLDLAVLCTESAGRAGMRTLEIIRSLTLELPCLLVTPDTSAAALCRALELRAYSVVHQPVDSEILARLLIRILQKWS